MDAETVSLISNIVVGVSAIIVAIAAVPSFYAWRTQLTGKAKFALAHDAMLLGYKLRAHFEGARDLLTYSTESADRTRKEDETRDISQVLDEWHARANRLKPLHENLIKIQEASWEAQILFSENSSKSVLEAVAIYRKKYAELTSAIYSYFDTRRREAATGHPYNNQDWLEKLHKTIYAPPEDDFSKQIDEATAKLESALQAYVK